MAEIWTAPRGLRRGVAAAQTGIRAFLPVDTNPVPRDWRHITKVDPEYEKRLPLLYPLYLRHTSAVSVGGSSDVTAENTEETFRLLEWATVPVFHEPSAPTHVTESIREQAAFVAIPEVLNGDVESLIGALGRGIEHIREELAPELLARKLPRWTPASLRDRLADFVTSWFLRDAVFEAYIIQNPDSAAAREAGVSEDDLLDPTEAKRRAMAAERHLGSEVLYLEYSGTFGGDEATAILDAVSDGVSWSRVWYGGGLDSAENAQAVLDAGADAVVVGNVFHEIAAEERDVCRRAEDALGSDATRAEIREWVESEVAVGEMSAVRYLSTVPSVTDPDAVAQSYLTATVATWLGVAAMRSRIGDAATPADVERVVGRSANEGALPGETALRPVLGEQTAEFAAQLAAGALTAETGIGADVSFPYGHLSLGGR